MNSKEYILGFVVGLISVLVVVAVIVIAIRKLTGAKQCKYDERQKLAQGKAYKIAYAVLLAYLVGASTFDMMLGIRWCDEFTFVMIGVMASIFVYACVCIWNDAYVNINQSPRTIVLILLGVGLIKLGISIMNLRHGVWVENGMLTPMVTNPMCAAMLLLVVLVFAIKQFVDKRRRQDEE